MITNSYVHVCSDLLTVLRTHFRMPAYRLPLCTSVGYLVQWRNSANDSVDTASCIMGKGHVPESKKLFVHRALISTGHTPQTICADYRILTRAAAISTHAGPSIGFKCKAFAYARLAFLTAENCKFHARRDVCSTKFSTFSNPTCANEHKMSMNSYVPKILGSQRCFH